jgi:hypothetical protein
MAAAVVHVPGVVVLSGGPIGAAAVRQLLRAVEAGRLVTAPSWWSTACRGVAARTARRAGGGGLVGVARRSLDGLGPAAHLVPTTTPARPRDGWRGRSAERGRAIWGGPCPQGTPVDRATREGDRAPRTQPGLSAHLHRAAPLSHTRGPAMSLPPTSASDGRRRSRARGVSLPAPRGGAWHGPRAIPDRRDQVVASRGPAATSSPPPATATPRHDAEVAWSSGCATARPSTRRSRRAGSWVGDLRQPFVVARSRSDALILAPGLRRFRGLAGASSMRSSRPSGLRSADGVSPRGLHLAWALWMGAAVVTQSGGMAAVAAARAYFRDLTGGPPTAFATRHPSSRGVNCLAWPRAAGWALHGPEDPRHRGPVACGLFIVRDPPPAGGGSRRLPAL